MSDHSALQVRRSQPQSHQSPQAARTTSCPDPAREPRRPRGCGESSTGGLTPGTRFARPEKDPQVRHRAHQKTNAPSSPDAASPRNPPTRMWGPPGRSRKTPNLPGNWRSRHMAGQAKAVLPCLAARPQAHRRARSRIASIVPIAIADRQRASAAREPDETALRYPRVLLLRNPFAFRQEACRDLVAITSCQMALPIPRWAPVSGVPLAFQGFALYARGIQASNLFVTVPD